MHNLKDDLDRQIYNQNLAVDILNIPNDEWQKSGDVFDSRTIQTLHLTFGLLGLSLSLRIDLA